MASTSLLLVALGFGIAAKPLEHGLGDVPELVLVLARDLLDGRLRDVAELVLVLAGDRFDGRLGDVAELVILVAAQLLHRRHADVAERVLLFAGVLFDTVADAARRGPSSGWIELDRARSRLYRSQIL